MKKTKIAFLLSITSVFIGSSFMMLNVNTEIPIGEKIPKAEVKMADVSGKEYALAGLKSSKGLLVIFSCNTCPYVKLSESRIKETTDYCKANGIGAIIINSNEASSICQRPPRLLD